MAGHAKAVEALTDLRKDFPDFPQPGFPIV
jgi:hypothetical protein